jgi:hypothetical protein
VERGFVEIKLPRGRISSSLLLRGSKQKEHSVQLQRGPGGAYALGLTRPLRHGRLAAFCAFEPFERRLESVESRCGAG